MYVWEIDRLWPVKASVHDTKHKNHPIIWVVMLMGSADARFAKYFWTGMDCRVLAVDIN